MAVFIISYDLRKPDFDYKRLYDALAELGAEHVQDSVWGLNTEWSAREVFDYLWQHMHYQKDRLFVVTFVKSESYRSQNDMKKLIDF